MSSSTTPIIEEKKPGLPSSPLGTPLDNLWTLTYRQGDNNRPKHMNFLHRSDTKDKMTLLREVIQRARLFCETTGRTFIVVSPFLTDLAAMEKGHADA